jgi:hypothetical protein
MYTTGVILFGKDVTYCVANLSTSDHTASKTRDVRHKMMRIGHHSSRMLLGNKQRPIRLCGLLVEGLVKMRWRFEYICHARKLCIEADWPLNNSNHKRLQLQLANALTQRM